MDAKEQTEEQDLSCSAILQSPTDCFDPCRDFEQAAIMISTANQHQSCRRESAV